MDFVRVAALTMVLHVARLTFAAERFAANRRKMVAAFHAQVATRDAVKCSSLGATAWHAAASKGAAATFRSVAQRFVVVSANCLYQPAWGSFRCLSRS